LNTVTNARDRIMARRGELAAQRSKGVRLYKWKPGKTLFRILPDKNDGNFERMYGKHWLKSFDGQQKLSIGDRQITYNQPCPVRNAIWSAINNAPTEEIKKHYQSMLASQRHVFQVLILKVNGAADPDVSPDTPVLVDVSGKQIDAIWQQFEVYSDIDETHSLDDAERGHIFQCQKQGTGYDTSYTFTAMPKDYPVTQDILDKRHELDAWVASEFEGMEQKAMEFLRHLNNAAGIDGAMLPGVAQAALPPVTSPTTGLSSAAATTIIDAEYDDSDVKPTAPVAQKPVEAPVAAPAPAPASSTDMDDLESILAELDM
jgi:hypothetical protein